MQSNAAYDLIERGGKGTDRLRVQIEFSKDAFNRLEELQSQTGASSKAEVIRDAVRIYEWLVAQSGAERFIEVQEADGTQVSRVEAKWFLR